MLEEETQPAHTHSRLLTERFLDIRNVPRVPTRPESPPREPDPPAVEREDLRSRSPSPELESADLPDDDPLAA